MSSYLRSYSFRDRKVPDDFSAMCKQYDVPVSLVLTVLMRKFVNDPALRSSVLSPFGISVPFDFGDMSLGSFRSVDG